MIYLKLQYRTDKDPMDFDMVFSLDEDYERATVLYATKHKSRHIGAWLSLEQMIEQIDDPNDFFIDVLTHDDAFLELI